MGQPVWTGGGMGEGEGVEATGLWGGSIATGGLILELHYRYKLENIDIYPGLISLN